MGTNSYVIARLFIVLALTLVALLSPVRAADITVDANCSLHNAIFAANENIAFRGCTAGSADDVDVITITVDVVMTESVRSIYTEMIIQGDTTSGDKRSISGDDTYRIFIAGGDTLTVRNLKLTKGISKQGGAIEIIDGTLIVDDVEFESNHATLSGGAISASVTSDVTISNSVFKSNTAGSIGGAISFYGSSASEDTLTISETTFTGNSSADTNAGALYIAYGNSTIKRSLFVDNETSTNSTSTDGGGGAIYLSERETDVDRKHDNCRE